MERIERSYNGASAVGPPGSRDGTGLRRERARAFATTQPTEVCTAPTSNENCSDYVAVTPDLAVVPAVEVLPEQGVSDHHPVVATVVLLMWPMDG